MCLAMTVQLKQPLGNRISEITREGTLSITERKNWRGNPAGLLILSEPGKGCACSMLTDDAEWGKPQWDMRAEVLSRIAATLKNIAAIASEGFEFESLWIGDKADKTEVITIEDMLRIVRSGKIGQKTRYQIRSRTRASNGSPKAGSR